MQGTGGPSAPSGGGGAAPTAGTGLAPNVAGALSYVLGIVTGVVFLLVEKDQFVRFHAVQSIIVSLVWIGAWIVLSILDAILFATPFLAVLYVVVRLLLSLALGLGGLILWIALIVKAYQGEQWKLPYVGDMAERYARSLKV